MKKVNLILINIVLLISLSSFIIPENNSAKKWQEEKIFVNGVCDMCKDRIEDAALIKGVRHAEWDKHKKELFVVYRPDKTSIDKIEKAIAEVGHDTKNHKADLKTYNSLPSCCKYRSGLKVH